MRFFAFLKEILSDAIAVSTLTSEAAINVWITRSPPAAGQGERCAASKSHKRCLLTLFLITRLRHDLTSLQKCLRDEGIRHVELLH